MQAAGFFLLHRTAPYPFSHQCRFLPFA
jgi:hypothetical protein